MRSIPISPRLFVVVSMLVHILGAPSFAYAWDVSIGTGFLDGALYVGSGSGTLPDWTTVDERVRASDQPGPTVPNNWVVQTWDPNAEEWPTDALETFEGVTQASIYNDDVVQEFWGSAEAFVFGGVTEGDAVGAAIGYDFEFVIQPFTTANIVLDPSETYLYIESSGTDVGTAFGQAKLFQTDVDINDPGGSNMPLASDFYSAEAGDPPVDVQPEFEAAFSNTTSSPVTYNLRFEASVSVLEVPEPAVGWALCLGGLQLAGLGRRRSSRATR